jgi:hypothetical protein
MTAFCRSLPVYSQFVHNLLITFQTLSHKIIATELLGDLIAPGAKPSFYGSAFFIGGCTDGLKETAAL